MKDEKEIRRYPIEITDASEIELPAGARILSVVKHYNEIALCAIVDSDMASSKVMVGDNVKKKISIRIVGISGQKITFDLKDYIFLGVIALPDGFVFHVFYHDHGYYG